MYENFKKRRITSIAGLEGVLTDIEQAQQTTTNALTVINGDKTVAGSLLQQFDGVQAYTDAAFAAIDLSAVQANTDAIQVINTNGLPGLLTDTGTYTDNAIATAQTNMSSVLVLKDARIEAMTPDTTINILADISVNINVNVVPGDIELGTPDTYTFIDATAPLPTLVDGGYYTLSYMTLYTGIQGLPATFAISGVTVPLNETGTQQVRYDGATQTFVVNNDTSTSNPASPGARIDAIINNADAALNTLLELSTFVEANAGDITALETTVNSNETLFEDYYAIHNANAFADWDIVIGDALTALNGTASNEITRITADFNTAVANKYFDISNNVSEVIDGNIALANIGGMALKTFNGTNKDYNDAFTMVNIAVANNIIVLPPETKKVYSIQIEYADGSYDELAVVNNGVPGQYIVNKYANNDLDGTSVKVRYVASPSAMIA